MSPEEGRELAVLIARNGIPMGDVWGAGHTARVRLRNGLTIRVEEHYQRRAEFVFELNLGEDPLAGRGRQTTVEYGRTSNPLEIGELTKRSWNAVGETKLAMRGENRDVLKEARNAFPALAKAPLVIADGPVDGRIAMRMRGLEFIAWHEGRRYSRLYDLVQNEYLVHHHGSEVDRSTFSIDRAGHTLTCTPLLQSLAYVSGVLRSSNAEEHWLSDLYEKKSDGWRSVHGQSGFGPWQPLGRDAGIGDLIDAEDRTACLADALASLSGLERSESAPFARLPDADLRLDDFDRALWRGGPAEPLSAELKLPRARRLALARIEEIRPGRITLGRSEEPREL